MYYIVMSCFYVQQQRVGKGFSMVLVHNKLCTDMPAMVHLPAIAYEYAKGAECKIKHLL